MDELKKLYTIGNVGGLRLTATPAVLIWVVVLWLVLAAVGVLALDLPVGAAFVGGFVAALLHQLAELLHQFGHAWMAANTGYPMIGVRFWFLLGASVYPKDEGDLPRSVHIRRALGGIPASIMAGGFAAMLAILLLAAGAGPVVWWVVSFFAVDNVVVFGLGSLLPLGFTDGSTILRNLTKN